MLDLAVPHPLQLGLAAYLQDSTDRTRSFTPGFTDSHARECMVAWLPAGATSDVSTGSRACAPTDLPATLDHARLRRARDNTGFGCLEAFFPPRSRTPSSPK